MNDSKELKKYLDDFNKIILNFRSVDIRVVEEDQTIILFGFLPKSYENIMDIMLYEKEILSMGDVKSIMNSREIQRRSVDKILEKTNVILV